MNRNVGVAVRLGGQLASIFAVKKGLVRARADNDRLRLVEAVVHAAAIALAVAIIVRELRQGDRFEEAVEESVA